MKRSSPLSDSRVVNHRGFERTRGVCRGLWVSKLGRRPSPGRTLIYHGKRPQLFPTNKRQAVWATCHRAFNCLFLSPPTHPHTSLSHTQTSPRLNCLPLLSYAPVPLFLCVSIASVFSLSLSFPFPTSPSTLVKLDEKVNPFLKSKEKPIPLMRWDCCSGNPFKRRHHLFSLSSYFKDAHCHVFSRDKHTESFTMWIHSHILCFVAKLESCAQTISVVCLFSFSLQHCRNWVSSPEPLDTPLEPMLPDCPRVSAGIKLTLYINTDWL